jgi:hypothetical protein
MRKTIYVAAVMIFALALIYISQSKAKVEGGTDDTLRNAERAHIALESFTVHGVREIASKAMSTGAASIDFAGPIHLTYRMRNYGRTLAWTKNITFQVVVADKFYLAQPPVYDNPTSTGAKYLIPPNAHFDTFEQFPVQRFDLSSTQAKAILEGRQFLFVYGFIEYVDVFERQHISRFAYCYRFKADAGSDFREPVGFPEHWEYR